LTTTTGDIIYASAANTPARLGIGSTGQILKVSGGLPVWGAAASGMTLITRQTFSAVGSVSVNSVFSDTYNVYHIYFENVNNSTQTGDLQMKFTYGTTPTQQSANYNYSFIKNTAGNPTTITGVGNSSVSNIRLTDTIGDYGSGQLFVNISNNMPFGGYFYVDQWAGEGVRGNFTCTTQRTGSDRYTGFYFETTAGNITGAVSVYGLAAA
jgi:hypothetical protein